MINKLLENWKSGLTIALVSLPIAISLAIASHATPTAGIITAIWAGGIAALFGGSNYNIIGPTGALSGILATYALTYGSDKLSMIAILAGLFILIAYFCQFEKYLILIPGSAIQGFTLGIAGIIMLGQLNNALGIYELKKHKQLISNVKVTLLNLDQTDLYTFGIFILFLCLLFVSTKIIRSIPAIILLSPVGIVCGYAASNGFLPFSLATLGSKYGSIQATLFEAPFIGFHHSMLFPAGAVALIAMLETLISAKIADGITKTKHHKKNELLGLAFANIGSGVCGGFPATAALARTALNIKAGATHKISAFISSCFITLFSIGCLSYFNLMPLAVIAAMLTFISIRMIEREHLYRLYHVDKRHFIIALAVAGTTILEDPIIGILLGTTLALILFIEKISRGQCELLTIEQDCPLQSNGIIEPKQLQFTKEILVYSIKGQLVYINAQAHIARFENDLTPIKTVILYLHGLYFIDPDGVDAFEEICELIEKKEINLFVCDANDAIYKILKESKIFCKLEKNHKVFKELSEALQELKQKNNS